MSAETPKNLLVPELLLEPPSATTKTNTLEHLGLEQPHNVYIEMPTSGPGSTSPGFVQATGSLDHQRKHVAALMSIEDEH